MGSFTTYREPMGSAVQCSVFGSVHNGLNGFRVICHRHFLENIVSVAVIFSQFELEKYRKRQKTRYSRPYLMKSNLLTHTHAAAWWPRLVFRYSGP